MKLKSWRGWDPDTMDLWFGVEDAELGRWNPVYDVHDRPGAFSYITGVRYPPRTFSAVLGNHDGSRSIEASWALALQHLNPLDESPALLVVVFNDGTEWTGEARMQMPAPVVSGTVNTFRVSWILTDSRWLAPSPDSAAGVVTPAPINNPSFASNTTGWTMGPLPPGITANFNRDAGVFFDSAGSGRVQVTANSSGVDVGWYVENNTTYPCGPGTVIQIKAATRSSVGYLGGVGVSALPVVRWYNASNVAIGENPVEAVFIPGDVIGANTWVPWFTQGSLIPGPAPAGTAYAKIGVRIDASPGVTGTVYFDAFDWLTAPFVAVPFTIEGNAPTNITCKATPAGNFPQAIYARSFTITNTGEKPLNNYPYEVNLGNTTGSATNGAYSILIRDGKPQPCEITGWKRLMSRMWMVIDDIPAGASADYTLLVSDQTVLPGEKHNFSSYNKPSFDTGFVYTTVAAGSTTTTTNLTTSSLGTENNRWIGGTVYVLSGAQAGTMIGTINSSTASAVTHAALPGALANGVLVLICMSRNDKWVYPVRKTERNEDRNDTKTRGSTRGIYYLDRGQSRPGVVRMDVPGAWQHDLYFDNNDHFVQKRCTPFDPGGGADYVAIFDVNRTWRRPLPTVVKYRDEGGFDGVVRHSTVPITHLQYNLQFKNPNGMCKVVVGSRQQNGETEWNHEWELATASASLTDYPTILEQAMPDGTYSVSMHLVPNGGDEIGESWQGDQGTATGGTSTTLTDSSKNWIPGQFVGGTVQIISGAGAGPTVPITANTANGLTVASWPNGAPDGTSNYRIRNGDFDATARMHSFLAMRLNVSSIQSSAIGAETAAYVLYRDILLSDWDGVQATPRQRVAISPEATGRYIVLLANESLVIDGGRQRVWIANTATDAFNRTVPPLAYQVYDITSDGSLRMAPRWLWANPGDHTLAMATDEPGVVCSIDVEWTEAMYS